MLGLTGIRGLLRRMHHHCSGCWPDLLRCFKLDRARCDLLGPATATHGSANLIVFLLHSRILEAQVLGGVGHGVFAAGAVDFGVVVVLGQLLVRLLRKLKVVRLMRPR